MTVFGPLQNKVTLSSWMTMFFCSLKLWTSPEKKLFTFIHPSKHLHGWESHSRIIWFILKLFSCGVQMLCLESHPLYVTGEWYNLWPKNTKLKAWNHCTFRILLSDSKVVLPFVYGNKNYKKVSSEGMNSVPFPLLPGVKRQKQHLSVRSSNKKAMIRKPPQPTAAKSAAST